MPAGNALSGIRRLVRWASLAAFLAVALAWPVVLGYLLPALSPHIAAGAALARRVLGLGAFLSVPVLALILLRRRGFCRWLCPTGRVLELCSHVRPRAQARAWGRVPFVGQWLAAATFAGAAVGLPLFLWTDPLAIFAGALGALRHPAGAAAAASAAAMLLLVGASLLLPGLWCARLCPLGGVQEALATLRGPAPRDEAGTESSQARPRRRLARRAALGAGCGFSGALALGRLLRARPKPLRPPGAADEATLRGLCLRCGNCVRVCPSGIVRQDLRLADPTGLLTPVLRFDGDYCREECRACGLSCPSGAIERLPLAEKNRRLIGTAHIDLAGCLLTQEKECGHCIPACPYAAIEERFSEATWTASVRLDAARCNGCGACLRVCPPRVITVHPV